MEVWIFGASMFALVVWNTVLAVRVRWLENRKCKDEELRKSLRQAGFLDENYCFVPAFWTHSAKELIERNRRKLNVLLDHYNLEVYNAKDEVEPEWQIREKEEEE